jgi:GT2 family glycosyltransferase
MTDSFDLDALLRRIVLRRLVRRRRRHSPITHRLPLPLLVMSEGRRVRRRIERTQQFESNSTYVAVTCRVGNRTPAALDVRIPGFRHICFTDRPEGIPAHWSIRPIEYWASTDHLTQSWIECHVHRLVGDASDIVWIDPDTAKTRSATGVGREGWLALGRDDRSGQVSTGSRRWFGNQTVVTREHRGTPVHLADRRSSDQATTIVVPVHDAPDDVERCLESVVRTMRDVDSLVIVDDGSQRETASICDRFAEHDRVSLIRRPQGSGFAAAANAGLESCDDPFVIVLNSDTRVPRGWVSSLVDHLDRVPEAAAVGPVSNAARFQSIPHLPGDDVDNRPPDGLDLDMLNHFLRRWSSGVAPIRVPLLNGFCLAFRTSALDEVGLFDTHAFPRGFGEENDWCQRATRAGYDLLVATDVYIEHAKGRSYRNHDVADLKAHAARVLAERYGKDVLERDLRAMRYPAALVALRADTQSLWDEMTGRDDGTRWRDEVTGRISRPDSV